MPVRPKIVVVGSINADLILSVARLPLPNETILSRDTRTAIGGKGLNQAVAAAKLGAEVMMIGAIGDDDLGAAARQHLRDQGIDESHVRTITGKPTGTAHIMVADDAANMIVVAAGANAALTPAMIDESRAAIAGADALVVQLEVPLPTVARALAVAREHGIMTVLNPAPADPAALALLADVDIVTPNETELASLTGIEGTGGAALHAGLYALRRGGAGTVLVTLGDRGSATLIDGTLVYQSAFRVEAIDTTGAGDCFNAALICDLAAGRDLLTAMQFAAAAAALAVSRASADAAPTRAEIDAFFRRPAVDYPSSALAVAEGVR